MTFAVWVTVGFFETNAVGRFNVAGLTYQSSFTCIPASLPSQTTPTGPVLLSPGTPLKLALPYGALLTRFEQAAKKGELLPYVEIRLVGGSPTDVVRLRNVRVQVWDNTTTMTRQVTLVQDI